MALRNLRDILGPLVLPIYDHEYTIAPISAEVGARLKLAAEGKPDPELAALDEASTYRLFLGDSYDEMVENKVSEVDIERSYITAIADFKFGRAAAEAAWEAGVSPEFRAALKAAAEKAVAEAVAKANRSRASRQSPNTAKESKTPLAGSSSTTSQRATPRRARKAPAKASNGARSSSR